MITPSGKAASIGRLIGWVAVVASLAFIGLQVWRQAPWQLAAAHLPSLTATVVIGAVLYGMAGFFLSSAWRCLLGADPSTASTRRHHAVYGRTQIAKYLPGNVFHLVGRQVMGRRLGHGQARLAFASLAEAILLLLIAGGLSLPIVWRSLDQTLLWVLVPAGLALVLMAVPWLYRHCHRRFCSFGDKVERATSRLLPAGLLYSAFFAVVAAIFWMLAWSVADSGGPSIDLVASISVVALAWLVGGDRCPGSGSDRGIGGDPGRSGQHVDRARLTAGEHRRRRDLLCSQRGGRSNWRRGQVYGAWRPSFVMRDIIAGLQNKNHCHG